MKLAWFRAGDTDPLDATAELLAELRPEHQIDVMTESSAHDFVWKDFRAPFDLCVFELDNAHASGFVHGYLLQYGGVLLLKSLPGDADAAEKGTWSALRVAISAARLMVVPHRTWISAVRDQYQDVPVRYAPEPARAAGAIREITKGQVAFGVLPTDCAEVVERGVAKARASGADAIAVVDASPERLLRDADVIVSLRAPGRAHADRLALAAMAAGKPLVTLETEHAADWPVFDPQTWRARMLATDAPIAVTIDLRDEEHSLMVAVQRLASDDVLRARLSAAAHAWWRAHARVAHAADAWRGILRDAAALEQPPRPRGWPVHLDADGSERARAILAEFGVTVDFLGPI